MRVLFVYDASLQLETVLDGTLLSGLDLSLFPLLEDEALKAKLTSEIHNISSFVTYVFDSARLVEQQVEEFRGLSEWSASLGASKVKGRSLKETLLIPGIPLSAWWLGHFSERNPLKTNAFLRLAQIAAIRNALIGGGYDSLVLVVDDLGLRQALAIVGEQAGVFVRFLAPKKNLPLKERLLAITRRAGAFGQMLRACYTWTFFLRRALIARHLMRGAPRSGGDVKSPLIISYFAAVEKSSASEGIFRNKYFLPLQDLIIREGKEIIWLLLYVPIHGYSFQEACILAKKFAVHGEKVAVLEEYLSVFGALSAFALWLRVALRAIRLYPRIDRSMLYPESVGPAAEPIIKDLWWSSYCGPATMEGILYLKMLQAYFKNSPHHKDIIYFFENHPWEKALITVGRQHLQNPRFLAYQHTTIPRNLFPYFCSHRDTEPSTLPDAMPLPDHVIANGTLMKSLFHESKFPGIVEAEAFRYFYLEKILSDKNLIKSDQPTLLIAGSIDRKEMLSVMKFVKPQLHLLDNFSIWVKGHPGLPMESILKEAGIDPLPPNWLVSTEDIAELLPPAWGVLVPGSTVAVEALACGCEVIVPVFPDALTVNPLADFDEYYHSVHNASEFASALDHILQASPSEERRGNCREFLERYWSLDPKMPRWSKLLFEHQTLTSASAKTQELGYQVHSHG